MKLKIKPLVGKRIFLDAEGRNVGIVGTTIARISDKSSRGITSRLAICRNM